MTSGLFTKVQEHTQRCHLPCCTDYTDAHKNIHHVFRAHCLCATVYHPLYTVDFKYLNFWGVVDPYYVPPYVTTKII